MKDEIKEILELLKTDMKHIRLFKEDRDKLLDYITNLQEENKELLEKFSNKIEEVSNLIKENEKLKIAKDTKCASEILCECLNNVYKSRNEKAIEILEQDKASVSFNTAERIALNILNGGDKDE